MKVDVKESVWQFVAVCGSVSECVRDRVSEWELGMAKTKVVVRR